METTPQTPPRLRLGRTEAQTGKKDGPMTITIKTSKAGADTLTDALQTYAQHFPEFAATAQAILRNLRTEE